MSDPIARWHEEHANFERLLVVLERQLDLVGAGEAPNYELMLDVMYYMTHYPDLFHHPVEDLAFHKIKARNPKVAALVDELLQEHDALRREGQALVHVLDDIVNDAIHPREMVESRGRAYVQCFRKHMASEDGEVFPAAAAVLAPADWADVIARLPREEDPLFGAAVACRYQALDEQIRREAKFDAR